MYMVLNVLGVKPFLELHSLGKLGLALPIPYKIDSIFLELVIGTTLVLYLCKCNDLMTGSQHGNNRMALNPRL